MKLQTLPPINRVESNQVRFLSAVPPALRNRVRATLLDPRLGGRGLRAWLALVEIEGRPLPSSFDTDLVSIYLSDPEAEPLYDCEECGLAVPVRAGRRCGHEPTCDRVYFAACPRDGAVTLGRPRMLRLLEWSTIHFVSQGSVCAAGAGPGLQNLWGA